MPQPFDLDQDEIVARTLTEEQFRAIGQVAVEWTHMEHAFALACAIFARSSVTAMTLMLFNMTSRGKIDTTGGLAGAALNAQQIGPYREILNAAQKLGTRRNTIIHSHYIGLSKKGRAVLAEIKSRRDSFDARTLAWDTREIHEVAAETSALFHRHNQFLFDAGFWNGKHDDDLFLMQPLGPPAFDPVR